VGSDGLILLAPPQSGGAVRMRMYNADGSESEMCGNGVRCLAKLAFDLGVVVGRSFVVETLGGPKAVELIPSAGPVTGARVSMGVPAWERAAVPMRGHGSALEIEIEAANQLLVGTGVSMGNPHFVLFVDELSDELLSTQGPLIESHHLFPDRVNVEFVKVIDRTTLRMRVWERGSGETLACGTGACAALVAAVLTKQTERKVTCQLPGGSLELSWPANDAQVEMMGPATLVFTGELRSQL